MKNIRKLQERARLKFKDITQFEDHKMPTSRRDFIKMGLIFGGASLIPGSFLTSLSANAMGTSSLPFMVFDLAGGAGLSANFLVGQRGGPEDLCLDYRSHGWNPRESQSLVHTYGIPMSRKRSQILAGMESVLPEELKNSS